MRSRGLTLIELIVTLAIMAFLVFATLPSISTWLSNQRIRNTASSIASGIQYAQAEAVRRNRPVSFWLVSLSSPTVMDNSCAASSSSGSWVVTLGNTAPSSNCAAGASTLQLKMGVAGEGANTSTVSATNSSGAANQITFNGFGQITNASAISAVDVSGSSGTLALRVTINPGGQVKVCDPNVNTATDTRSCS